MGYRFGPNRSEKTKKIQKKFLLLLYIVKKEVVEIDKPKMYVDLIADF